jgi:putative phosphoribosyl transferase
MGLQTRSPRPIKTESVSLHVEGATLEGDLSVPESARGIVLFAHGSGSSRKSPRNRRVARTLNEAGFATMLVDLLTPAEEAADERTGQLRFDIPWLAERLMALTDWLTHEPATRTLPLGYFGASTGAAAALVAAARRVGTVGAVVSRGGRPDLAGDSLPRVAAPTLLIVGSHDYVVLDLNRAAQAKLRCEHALMTVPGATHLFEEPGALDRVAHEAARWFDTYLVRSSVRADPRGGQLA